MNVSKRIYVSCDRWGIACVCFPLRLLQFLFSSFNLLCFISREVKHVCASAHPCVLICFCLTLSLLSFFRLWFSAQTHMSLSTFTCFLLTPHVLSLLTTIRRPLLPCHRETWSLERLWEICHIQFWLLCCKITRCEISSPFEWGNNHPDMGNTMVAFTQDFICSFLACFLLNLDTDPIPTH